MSFFATDGAWIFAAAIWGFCVLLVLLIGWQETRAYRRDAGERARVRAEEMRVRECMRGARR